MTDDLDPDRFYHRNTFPERGVPARVYQRDGKTYKYFTGRFLGALCREARWVASDWKRVGVDVCGRMNGGGAACSNLYFVHVQWRRTSGFP